MNLYPASDAGLTAVTAAKPYEAERIRNPGREGAGGGVGVRRVSLIVMDGSN